MATQSLPPQMKALVLESTSKPPSVQTIPTPQVELGTAVVRILSAATISYAREIYSGIRPYPFPMPFVPGGSAIGRVAAVGPDATKLKSGDLVLVDCFIHSRDDPSDCYLAGVHQGFSAGSKKLMTDVYRNWTLAEYTKAPLENLFLLDEKRLTASPDQGGLAYEIDHLPWLFTLVVPYGGLRDIELKAGETVVVAPATGPFGGAAVCVALAMGARVIAMGRNQDSLKFLAGRVPHPERLSTVPITGDVQGDCDALKAANGGALLDAFFDIGPPQAHNSTHIKSCLLALRHGGRMSLMGGYREDVALPVVSIMHKNQRIFGKWMYNRADVDELIKMVEVGVLKVGPAGGCQIVSRHPLEEWKQAWDAAAENARMGEVVLMKP